MMQNITNKSDAGFYDNDWPNAAGFQAEAEQRQPKELPVQGHFPSALSGTLYRTGPAQRKFKDFELSHWFDGFTQVYRFQLIPKPDGGCKIVYNSRRQCDGLLEKAQRTKRLDNITFGQKRDPCEGFFGKLKTLFFAAPDSSVAAEVNCGVTIHKPVHGSVGLLETCTDSPQLKTIDRETLEPVGVSHQNKLHPDLKGHLSCAHANFDPVTGDCYNFIMEFGPAAKYRIFRRNARSGTVDILATFSAPDTPHAYMHSFFLSENYVILCVWNSHFSAGGMSVLWQRNYVDALKPFDSTKPAQWFVVDRKGDRGLVKRFTSRAFFAFHTVNAYEKQRDDGASDIVCDVVEYSSSKVLHSIYYDCFVPRPSVKPVEIKESILARYTLEHVPSDGSWDLAKGIASVATETLRMTFDGDLPTINPSYKTKTHRYIYGIGDRGKSTFYDCIIKTDTEAQEQRIWARDKHTPGEALFINDPERRDREDGGWLLSCVLDGITSESYLLCLDAETLEEVGRADVGAAVGLGFHGNHMRL